MKHLKQPQQSKSGFTMVEFSLATAFISLLLIGISVIASNIITIYQKGLAVKAVGSVGRGLVEEFTTAINSAPSVDTASLCSSHVSGASEDACKKDNANNFIFQHKLGRRVAPGNETDTSVQFGGVFCTGNYSYVWNTYYGTENGGSPLSLVYYDSTNYSPASRESTKLSDFRMIRVKDSSYRVCSAVTNSNYTSNINNVAEIDITHLANGRENVIDTPEQGFLNSFDLDLQLYELTMFPISQDQVTLRTFMSGTFILATERGNVNIERSGDYCDVNHLDQDQETTTALSDLGSEFTYCSINKFNFAARTAGM